MYRITITYLIIFSYNVMKINCFTLVFPGTKWCGKGNIANNSNDLGFAKEIDECCRDHDLCPDNITSNQTKYGLINNGLITKSSCRCDKKLFDCLKTVNSFLSNIIGNIYFNILKCKCFDYECVIKPSEFWEDCNTFKDSGNITWYNNEPY